MNRKHIGRRLVAVLLASLAAAATAQAGGYPEKNIEFVVGYKPGGGYSDWALAIAPFIEKHLPKKVNVVVRHMPGAGNVTAANYLHKANPDGYTIGIYNMVGLAATQLGRKVAYDLGEVTWLARLSVDNGVALVNANGPYSSIWTSRNKLRQNTSCPFGAIRTSTPFPPPSRSKN